MKSLNLQIQKLAEESPLLRAKCKGDALVQNDMYVQAIQVYQKLLEEENIEEVREGFTESVYHNLGCAYSYLFQMEKAVECFHRAYEGSRTRKALETYLLAVGVTRTPAEYQSVVRRLGVEKEVLQDIKEKLAKGTAGERSDIEIAVSGVAEFDELLEKVEELPTLYSVDLLNMDTCRNDLLMEDIKQYGREI